MASKAVVVVMLVMLVAAAEGRARGAKLGHRRSKMPSVWGQLRQDAGGYNAVGAASGYQGVPQYQTTAYSQPATQTAVQPQTAGYGGQSAQQQVQVVSSGLSPLQPSICQYPGFFPTPGSCVNFYRCVDFNGRGTHYSVFQFNCPAGTIFDDDLDVCNHIAWTVPKRPECSGMLSSSVVPEGSTPDSSGGAITGGSYPSAGGSETAQGTVSVDGSPGTLQGGSPAAPPRPFSLECRPDNTYRRHPLYCNRYYYCVWNGDDWVFPIFTCPQDLVFNVLDQQCANPASTVPCDGELAPYPTPQPVTTDMPTESPATDTPTGQQGPAVDPSSLYDCPSGGYFPFEGDCIRFYKCVELESGALKGLLYKCPAGYGYSETKGRCDKMEKLPPCTKVSGPAHQRFAAATQLYPDDLLWFFNQN